jgi:hypothetical protein
MEVQTLLVALVVAVVVAHKVEHIALAFLVKGLAAALVITALLIARLEVVALVLMGITELFHCPALAAPALFPS